MTNPQTPHNDVEAIRKLLGEALDSPSADYQEVQANKSGRDDQSDSCGQPLRKKERPQGDRNYGGEYHQGPQRKSRSWTLLRPVWTKKSFSLVRAGLLKSAKPARDGKNVENLAFGRRLHRRGSTVC